MGAMSLNRGHNRNWGIGLTYGGDNGRATRIFQWYGGSMFRGIDGLVARRTSRLSGAGTGGVDPFERVSSAMVHLR